MGCCAVSWNSTGWPSNKAAARTLYRASFAIPPILKIVALVVFAQTLFTRAVDPVIPQIAADLHVHANTVALLSTAFTLPYALVQPVLGTIADFFGKTRLMNVSLLVVSLAGLVCAVATSFELLVAMRILAGLLAGGIFPVGMALIGDLMPVEKRQVAIGRLLAVGLTGNVLGASFAGAIGDLFGWRAYSRSSRCSVSSPRLLHSLRLADSRAPNPSH